MATSAEDYSPDKMADMRKEFTVRMKQTIPEPQASTPMFVSSDLSAIPTKNSPVDEYAEIINEPLVS